MPSTAVRTFAYGCASSGAEAVPSASVQLSAEPRIVIECVRGAFGHPGAPLAGLVVDWAAVVRLAFQQGLVPLVHAGLPALDLSVPETVRAELRAGYLGAVVRTEVWVEPTLRRTLGTLRRVGVEPIVLKGGALAYLTYPEPAQRTLADIDLLLRPADLCRASDALIQRGYFTDPADAQATHHLQPHYADEGRVGVELHQRLFPEPTPYAIDLEQLWTRSQVERIAGVDAHVLGPPDALLLVCVHFSYAHRYRWFPLRTLTDIFGLAASRDDLLDWGLFLDSVRRSGTAGAVYWPLWLARSWLGAPIPDAVLSSLAPATPIRKLVAAAIAEPRFLLDHQDPPERGDGDLRRVLLDLSLYAGPSTAQQVARYLGSPGRVARHIGPYLSRPERLARLLVSLGRVAARAVLAGRAVAH